MSLGGEVLNLDQILLQPIQEASAEHLVTPNKQESKSSIEDIKRNSSQIKDPSDFDSAVRAQTAKVNSRIALNQLGAFQVQSSFSSSSSQSLITPKHGLQSQICKSKSEKEWWLQVEDFNLKKLILQEIFDCDGLSRIQSLNSIPEEGTDDQYKKIIGKVEKKFDHFEEQFEKLLCINEYLQTELLSEREKVKQIQSDLEQAREDLGSALRKLSELTPINDIGTEEFCSDEEKKFPHKKYSSRSMNHIKGEDTPGFKEEFSLSKRKEKTRRNDVDKVQLDVKFTSKELHSPQDSKVGS